MIQQKFNHIFSSSLFGFLLLHFHAYFSFVQIVFHLYFLPYIYYIMVNYRSPSLLQQPQKVDYGQSQCHPWVENYRTQRVIPYICSKKQPTTIKSTTENNRNSNQMPNQPTIFPPTEFAKKSTKLPITTSQTSKGKPAKSVNT